jgi:hypothetical protein
VTVEFGPSRSKRFGRAVTEAQSGPGECHELEPGRYRVSFLLGEDAGDYVGLARLLQRVRHWRATEGYLGEELVSTFQAREMAWCASPQLKLFGECRFRFSYGVFPAARSVRCSRSRGRSGTSWAKTRFRRSSWKSVTARGFAPSCGVLDKLDQEFTEDWQVPDFPPEEWEQPGEEPPG